MRVDYRKYTRWAIYFLMFTVVGLTVSTALICIFECWPSGFDRSLAREVHAGRPATGILRGKWHHQVSIVLVFFFLSNQKICLPSNSHHHPIVQEIFIYLLPVPMMWKLQVPRRQKFAVLFLFRIGIVALIGMLAFLRFIQN